MLFIFRAKKKRQSAVLFLHLFQFLEQIFSLSQFSAIFRLEARPFLYIVTEGFSECVARSNVFHPQIDLRGFFFHASWPEAVHPHAPPRLLRRLVVPSLDWHQRPTHGQNASTSAR